MREPERLTQRTHTGRIRVVDRSEMIGCSKRSIIELVRTRLFKSLYFDSLVELWTRYIETELADYPEKAELFKAYLEDIIDAVE